MISEHYQSDVVLRLLVALICFLYALPYVVMQINAGGILSEVLFPDVQHAFEIGATGLALVTMVYIMVGGMRSVAWTDVVQGSFLLGGMLLAGIATVCVLGGVDGFLEKVSRLPPKSLSAPGTTGSWPPEKLFTVCIFSSLGSMIQPAQWMRYYAARSGVTLRRSALIFGTVLPICFFFGVMLVGLGGQALYPIIDSNGQVLPHPDVGATARDFDKILVVTLRDHLPELMGAAGVFLSTLILVAIMAASMSTADSNLHAMSAVVTRDVYDRFLRPHASEREKTWLGRFVIAVVTILALLLILWGRQSVHFNPVALLAQMGLLAISFSTQLVPVTVDMLFLRRGTKWGAIAGTAAGVSVVFAFTPLFSQLVSGNTALLTSLTSLRKMIDIGALGCGVNSAVFLIVSVIEHRVRGGNHAQ
jgi:SSS family solute:Na+ symporter